MAQYLHIDIDAINENAARESSGVAYTRVPCFALYNSSGTLTASGTKASCTATAGHITTVESIPGGARVVGTPTGAQVGRKVYLTFNDAATVTLTSP